MCTRFHLAPETDGLRSISDAVRASRLAAAFAKTGKTVLVAGEIRPTDVVPVIAPGRNGIRAAFPMQWGFRLRGGSLVVNARLETAAEKPSFRDSWAGRRCAIPACWYYEWEHRVGPDGKTTTGGKYRIRPAATPVTWLCGLYRMEGALPVFAVLTRDAPSGLAWLHERIPLILPPDRIDAWIQPSTRPENLLPHALAEMLVEKAEP